MSEFMQEHNVSIKYYNDLVNGCRYFSEHARPQYRSLAQDAKKVCEKLLGQAQAERTNSWRDPRVMVYRACVRFAPDDWDVAMSFLCCAKAALAFNAYRDYSDLLMENLRRSEAEEKAMHERVYALFERYASSTPPTGVKLSMADFSRTHGVDYEQLRSILATPRGLQLRRILENNPANYRHNKRRTDSTADQKAAQDSLSSVEPSAEQKDGKTKMSIEGFICKKQVKC